MQYLKYLFFPAFHIILPFAIAAQSKTDSIKQPQQKNDSSKILKDVIITAKPPLIERQVDKTVINVGQNITNDGLTVMDLMKKLPGVQVTGDGQISLHGKPGVTVYIDGKPTYLSAEDLSGLLSSMNASSIQKVEIMTNPSSRYDASAIAGIINIVKKRNRTNGLNGSINTSFTQASYSKYNGSFTINYKNQRFNLFVNNSYNYNKNYRRTSVTSDILNSSNNLVTEQISSNRGTEISKTYRPSVALDYYLSQKTTLSFSGTAGWTKSDNGLHSAMDIADSMKSTIGHIGFTSILRDKPFNYTTGLQFTQLLDTTGGSFSIAIDHSSYHNYPVQNNYNEFSDAQYNVTGEMNYLLLQQRNLDINAAKADYIKLLAHSIRFETGIKTSYVKAVNDNNYYNQDAGINHFDSSHSNYSINTENINAAYLTLNKQYKKLIVQAGLRTEQTVMNGKQILTGESISQNYWQVFPTLFADYTINDQHSFNFKTGRRIERAAYNELVPFRRPQTATLFFQGNPNLQPQISWHGEFTWGYRKAFFVTLNYDLYRNYIRTLPFADSNKTTITRTPINIQDARAWDIDFAYAKKITSWWSTDNTVSLYLTSFNGTSHHSDLDNNGIVSLYISSNNSFTITKKLSAELDDEYNSRRQYVNSTFGAYSILNFGCRWLLFKYKGSVSLNAHNIFQSENHNAIDRTAGFYQYAYLNFFSRSVSINFSCRFGSSNSNRTKFNSGSADQQNRAGN
jgi:hypothetical protein